MLNFVLSLLGLTVGLVMWITISWPDERLRVFFCDVGQGDAILVTWKTTQVLIDGGPDNKVLECLSRFMPFWDRSLEMVVISHMDKDHIAGLAKVLDKYQVKTVSPSVTQDQTEIVKSLEDKIHQALQQGTTLEMFGEGKTVIFDKRLSFTALSPQESRPMPSESNSTESMLSDQIDGESDDKLDKNDLSTVLLLQFGEFDCLLTGDIGETRELALVDRLLIPDVDVLKVAHHGSKTSSSARFIEAARPEISVVSAGKNNAYGHPAAVVVARLEEVGSRIMRTDELGTILITTDGSRLWASVR